MELSRKFQTKLLNAQFEDVSDAAWYRTTVWWIIDSQFRRKKRLDLFIQDQLEYPMLELKAVAAQMSKKYGKDYDRMIVAIVRSVVQRVKYSTDNDTYGMLEMWQEAQNTWNLRKGDCDDINSLIYVIARLAGIPYWQLFQWLGNVADPSANNGQAGHYACLYWSVKRDKLVAIDGTYYPSYSAIQNRPPFEHSDKLYSEAWYVFNEEGIYRPRASN